MLQEFMISAFKKAMAVFVACTTIVATTTPSAFAGSSGDGCATPIQHIVIIFQENVSFDHYFATYPNAMNPPGEPAFHAAPRTPNVNGLTYGLLTANPNLNPLNLAGAGNPFRISPPARGEQMVLKNDAGVVMQFRVSGNPAEDPSSLPAVLRTVPRIPEAEAVRTRLLTLDEYDNGVAEPILMLLNASHWKMPITEKPILNSTEIWTFINPTDDSHPIHLHLVRFQILDRQRYEPWTYQTTGKLKFSGSAVPAEPNEAGWKDTVRADPRMVTRIIVRFEGFTGRYVWHCHILEHEDNEMMRPYEVIAAPERPS